MPLKKKISSTKAKAPRIVCCIVTYKREDDFNEALESAISQTRPFDHIVVHDNNPTDRTKSIVKAAQKKFPEITHILSENIGGAKTFESFVRNNYKTYDYIFMTDDDVVFQSDTLEKLCMSSAFKQGDFGYLGSLVLDYKSRVVAPVNFPLLLTENNLDLFTGVAAGQVPIKTNSFTGMLLSSKAVKKCGFPYGDFVIYADDYEYSWRISKEFPCYLIPQSIFLHKGGQPISFAQTPKAGLWKHYYATRNLLFVYKKHRNVTLYFGDRAFELVRAVRHNGLGSGPHVATIVKGVWAGLTFKPKEK